MASDDIATRQSTTIRLSKDLHRALRHYAIDTGMPVNTLIERLCREFLYRHNERGNGIVRTPASE